MLQELMNEFWRNIHEKFQWDMYPPKTDSEYIIKTSPRSFTLCI